MEDCLHLNVFTPVLSPQERATQSLPVMVWIHGGGFFSGAGTTTVYGPDHFVDHPQGHGFILVSINYRVGPFGFFTLEDESAPGNIGLRDQVQALEWVRDNIGGFGGDPGDVTLFGESAGSMCIVYLMCTPRAKVCYRLVIG